MTTALYFDAGRVQVVLTAENDFDRQVLARLESHKGAVQIKRGEFYPCRGGWTRHAESGPMLYGNGADAKDDSVFLVLDQQQEAPVVAPVVDQNLALLRTIWGCISYGPGGINVHPGSRAYILGDELIAQLDAMMKS